MEAIEFYGNKYPVLKCLCDNCAVVCTPEGPAIYSSTHHSISALWLASDHVSNNTVKEAVSAVVEWAKDQPTYPGNSDQEADSDIDRYRREGDEQDLRKHEEELLRVTQERDAAITESKRKLGMLRNANDELDRITARLEFLIKWMDERRDSKEATTLGMIQDEIRKILSTESTQNPQSADAMHSESVAIETENAGLKDQIDDLRSQLEKYRAYSRMKDEALREAIDAFERYEMDVDDCASPAHRAMMTRIRTAISPSEGRPPATGKTAESSRQGILDSSPQPHNPDNLTPDQVGVSEGYRLLDRDEIIFGPRLDCIDLWSIYKDWSAPAAGNIEYMTYRTKLSREDLRKARGLGESDVSEHRTLVGTTLKISGKERDGLRKAIGMNDGKEAN